MESALRWKAKYDQAQHKSPDELAMESALRWKAKYDQAQHKSPDELAMESALRWKAKYGQELGKLQAKDRPHEREQTELTPSSAGRTRGRDFDLSL